MQDLNAKINMFLKPSPVVERLILGKFAPKQFLFLLPLFKCLMIKMKKLIRHELEFEQTLKYVQETIGNANELSIELLRVINFKNGVFFTLLPDDANIERIYEFVRGIVLVQNPV